MNLHPYSVVVPSIGREILLRAVMSLVNQTIPPQEIIVVGYNLPIKDLQKIMFTGLRVVETSTPQSASNNRQTGTKLVKTPYIAYLDDDDYWLPEKTAKQVEIVLPHQDLTIYNCRAHIESNFGEFDWPKEVIKEGTSIKEYLFDKIDLIPGKRYFPITGYFMKTEIALAIGWQEVDHDDWDFLFRAQSAGINVAMHEEILVVIDQKREGVSRNSSTPWPSPFLTKHSEQMSRDQLRNFLAGVSLQRLLNSGSWALVLKIFIQIIRLGFYKKSTLVAVVRILGLRNLFRMRRSYSLLREEKSRKAFDSGRILKKS